MLIITEMKVIEVERDMFEIQRMVAMPHMGDYQKSEEEASITREMIQGRRFRDSRNDRDIVIGWTQEVQDVLQMPFEAFDDMNAEVSRMRNNERVILDEMNTGINEIIRLRELSLWEHIKEWYKLNHK